MQCRRSNWWRVCGEGWVLESLVWAVRAGSAGIPPQLGLCLRVCCELWELRNHYSTTELRAHLWGTISEICSFVSITSLWKTQNQRSVLGCSILIIFRNFKEHLVQQTEGTFLLARDYIVHRTLEDCVCEYSKISSHTKLRNRVHL